MVAKRRVVVLRGDGCFPDCVNRSVRAFRDAGWRVKLVDIGAVRDAALENVDVVVVPGGDDRPGSEYGAKGQYNALAQKGRKALCDAVGRGATYLGVCAGAFLAVRLRLAPAVRVVKEHAFGMSAVRGLVSLEPSHTAPAPVRKALGPLGRHEVWYEDGPVLHVDEGRGGAVIAATYDEAVVLDGDCTPKKMYMKHKGLMLGQAAAVIAQYGQGAVALFGPHPELDNSKVVRAMLPRFADSATDAAPSLPAAKRGRGGADDRAAVPPRKRPKTGRR